MTYKTTKTIFKKPFPLYKKFLYVIIRLLQKLFGFIINIFIVRDSNLIILGNSPIPLFEGKSRSDNFLHNTKYLFLYANLSTLKVVYLCDNAEMIKKLKEKGFKNVYTRKSIKGVYYSLKAKYWFTDYHVETVTNLWLSYNAKIINLWHGIPLKKINNDIPSVNYDMSKLINKIRYLFLPKEDFYIVNSEYEQNCYNTAFLKSKEYIKILGSPRLDVLLYDIPNSDLFMEKDFENIKKLKEQGKKIFIYMPTFRDSGKNVSGWLKSKKVKFFFKK